jgi:hypothetical protein
MSTERKATMHDLKAHVIDEGHFRILAIPFGGPIHGGDLDGERFTKRTDIKPDWFPERPVLWHHGQDDYIGDEVIGKATDLKLDEEGWWVDVWLKKGQKHAELVQKLASKSPLYGSSGTIGYLKKTAPDGEILVWPYAEQTLTLAPSNMLSVSRPAKAMLEDAESAGIDVLPYAKALIHSLDNLGADLSLTSDLDGPGEVTAKAGRVLSARNEQAIREAMQQLDRILSLLRTQPDPPTEGDASP